MYAMKTSNSCGLNIDTFKFNDVGFDIKVLMDYYPDLTTSWLQEQHIG